MLWRKEICLAALLASVAAPRSVAADTAGDEAPYTVAASRKPQNLLYRFKPRAKYVLLISIDGLSYPAYRRNRYRMPNLLALSKRGFWRPLESTFPTHTWPAHASMTTGQHPRHHGVISNRWLEGNDVVRAYASMDADVKRRARTPSVFELVAAKGWKSAALNWPGTQGSTAISYNMPEFMREWSLVYKMMSPPLKRIFLARYRRDFRRARPSGYIQNLTKRIARTERIEIDMLVRDLSVDLITRRRGRPRLMAVHLLLPDTWGHKYGTAPWVERWSLELTDRIVGRILRAYRHARALQETAIFVASDHGMVEIDRAMDIVRLVAGNSANISTNGPLAFIHLKSGARKEALIKQIKAYSACIAAVFEPQEYRKLGLPVPPTGPRGTEAAPGEHAGAPDLLVVAKPGCIFSPKRRGPFIRRFKSWRIGHHGFLPRTYDMYSVLVGAGVGIKKQGKRVLSRASITSIAPTIAHLLGLRWPARWPAFPKRGLTLDGRIMTDVLAKAAEKKRTPATKKAPLAR